MTPFNHTNCGHRKLISLKYDIAYMPPDMEMPADADIREHVCIKPAGHPVDDPFDAHTDGVCWWPDSPTVVGTFSDSWS